MELKQKSLISVALISYNQVDFIREAMEGVLAQHCSEFDLEVVCGDDCSTDGTLVLLEEYHKLYPDKIRILPAESNLGVTGNWAKTIEACKGQYVAILEGDDRWDDTAKLEKQFNLLKISSRAVACFTNTRIIRSDGSYGQYNYVNKGMSDLNANTFFQLNHNPIPTCTVMFKKVMLPTFPEAYYRSPFADWIVHSLLIQQGHYIYLNECTSSYRQHDGGVWSGVRKEKQLLNKLKAIQLISTIVSSEYMQEVKTAYRTQLDQLLYFYRDEKSYWNYFSTWLKLKFH